MFVVSFLVLYSFWRCTTSQLGSCHVAFYSSLPSNHIGKWLNILTERKTAHGLH